jgi:hypothetical protein
MQHGLSSEQINTFIDREEPPPNEPEYMVINNNSKFGDEDDDSFLISIATDHSRINLQRN